MRILATTVMALGLLFAGTQDAEAHSPHTHNHVGVSISTTGIQWVWVSGYWSGGHYHSGYWQRVGFIHPRPAVHTHRHHRRTRVIRTTPSHRHGHSHRGHRH